MAAKSREVENISVNEKAAADKAAIDGIIKSLDVSGWTLSDERKFMENLFVGRFNYFLIVFSLFITAGFANTFEEFKSIVFFVGAFVLFLVWLLLYRGYKKHDRIMRIIYNNKKDHPASKIQSIIEIEDYKWWDIASKITNWCRVSKLMGVYIPWVFISLLLAIAIFVNRGVLK